MSKSSRKRPQTPKPRNEAFNAAMMEKGRSNATTPVPPKNRPRNRAQDKRSWKADL